MKSYDAAQLSTNLNALAETFDRKALTPSALGIWFENLKEFPTELVLGVLKSWPKTHGKFPTPAEIWNVANSIQIAERERTAAQLQAEAARTLVKFERTESGKRAMAEIKKLTRHCRLNPLSHWLAVLEREDDPNSIASRYAIEAIAALEGRGRRRQPGEDDEELAA